MLARPISLHPAKVVEILRRIHNLARVGYIVNDLRRNWLAIWVGEFLSRPVISSIFRHDASQSCRAAFTVGELRLMAKESGLKNFRITKHHAFLKMMLEGRK